MLQALEYVETKLREYFTLTDDKDLSDIYAIGTILVPQHKLQFLFNNWLAWPRQGLHYTVPPKSWVPSSRLQRRPYQLTVSLKGQAISADIREG